MWNQEHPSSFITEKIWVLDNSPDDVSCLQKAVGKHYSLRFFSLLSQIESALNQDGRDPEPVPGLLLSEVNLPDGDIMGLLRGNLKYLPPLMVISKQDAIQTVTHCLSLGAQDYFVKPINDNLLVAKINRFFSGRKSNAAHNLTDLKLDQFSLQMSNGQGLRIGLTLKEFQILSLFHKAYPAGVSRAAIHLEIWKDVKVVSKAFDVHLFKLRRKLESLGFEIQFASASYFLVRKMAP